MGLVGSGEGLSDQEIYRLIFLPGLSTAEKITDVSGRGVGMDVVKRAVEKLRGQDRDRKHLRQGYDVYRQLPPDAWPLSTG